MGNAATQVKSYIKESGAIHCPVDSWSKKDLAPLVEGADHCDTQHVIRLVHLVYQPLQEQRDGLLRWWNSVQTDDSGWTEIHRSGWLEHALRVLVSAQKP